MLPLRIGAYDALVPLSIGEQVYRCIPNAAFLVIAGASHNPMWDCPEIFNQEITAFLIPCGLYSARV